MLRTLVGLVPKRYKWLKRLGYVIMTILLVRAWIMQQTQRAGASVPQHDSTEPSVKPKGTAVDN